MLNILILVGALFLITSAVCDEDILQLTDEEYYQLPDLFVVENYEKCLSQRGNAFCAGTFELTAHAPSTLYDLLKCGNAFCAGTFELTAHAPSTLYDLLKKFSANERENFNHTRVHRAICLGPKSGCTIKGHLKDSFQECINNSMLTEYGLNAELANFFFCRRSGEELTVDGVDRAFIAYLGVIVLLNSMGTAYHFFVKEKGSKGNRWLMAFSLFDNWKRLSSPSESGDPRLRNFACFNGIKALSMVLVHLAHAPFIIIVSFMANPRFAESTARRPETVIMYSGNVIVQSFILVTNFLIGYRLLISSEKYKMSLSLLPKLIIDRIFRIYPMQLTAIGITATVAVHLCDGPLWRKYVTGEASLCRETWWHHVLFIHNFFAPKCIPQSWYMATDVQLYIISSIVMLWILGRGLDPEYVLKRLLAASVLGVFVGAYTLDLKPSLTVNSPEVLFTVFANERSFRLLYQSFWGNLPSAIIGLLLASIYYRLEKEKVDLSKNKTFVLLHQSAMPMGWIWTLMGYFFIFSLQSRFSTSLYATIDKPVFATIIAFIAMGCIYKIKGPSNAILSWPGWLVPSRLSLGALMLHVVVNKQITLSRIHSSTLSITNTVADWFAVSVITYLVVTPLALLVEYPFIQLYKIIRDCGSVRSIETEPKCVMNENNNIVEKYSKLINCKSKDL